MGTPSLIGYSNAHDRQIHHSLDALRSKECLHFGQANTEINASNPI